jgi:xylulokinase
VADDVTDLLLGLDIGTSSSKGVLATADGTIVARAERTHALSMPHPGWAEHDAEVVWWADSVAICRELTERAGEMGGTIVGAAVSGIGPCLLPVDAGYRPLRPAILYGIDTRASVEIAELERRYGPDRILDRGGSALTSQAVGPKLLWLQRHEPAVWARTRRFFMASSFVIHRLTGAYVLDHHSASQCDPLYDLASGDWAADWAADVAPDVELPDLRWATEPVGRVTSDGARATGIPEGTLVMAGTIDAWAEAFSVGVREPGDTMLMYGTTMFIVEAVADLRPDPTMWGTAGVLRGSRTLAAGMSTSGALTTWLRELAGGPPFETLLAEAASVAPGADGLVVLPYFAGERTPLFDPDARGLVLGLTLSHGRGHLYRALLEGTAYGVRHILEALQAAGGSPTRFVAVGGGTRGGLWTRVVSDVTGRAQDVPAETIGACYGDALFAAIGTGLVPESTRWDRVAAVVEPDPATRSRYDELYAIYRSLYPATVEQAHALAAIQAREAVGPPGSPGRLT